jgi:type IV pilus assembly protein PilQ
MSAPVLHGKFSSRLLGLAWLVAAAFVALPAQSQDAGRQLEAIEVQSLPGQRIELRLRTSGAAPQPMTFTIDDPARIALDLPDTALALSSRRQEVNLGPVTTVLAAEANGRTRIVVNMSTLVPYDTRVEGNSVIIEIGQQAGDGSTFAAQPAPQQPARAAAASGGPRSINNIDFRRGPDGAGQVLVELNDPRTTVDVRQEGGRVIVDFQNTSLPNDLLRRLDVSDFATPVATVDALQANNNARLVVTPSGDYDQVAYQSDNVFTLELKEPPEEEDVRGVFDADREYTGERLMSKGWT